MLIKLIYYKRKHKLMKKGTRQVLLRRDLGTEFTFLNVLLKKLVVLLSHLILKRIQYDPYQFILFELNLFLFTRKSQTRRSDQKFYTWLELYLITPLKSIRMLIKQVSITMKPIFFLLKKCILFQNHIKLNVYQIIFFLH